MESHMLKIILGGRSTPFCKGSKDNNTEKMSASKKKQWLENQKAQLKKSKEQLLLAQAKKQECDKKALTIVEQLLEPNVNPDWLIQNLKLINKCHMEDVIEERAIIRLCGYVLCSKPLTVIIKQQYHISTQRNKVYDVTKRKNFCSSLCYRASNYLLVQMLESPLWLRDMEEIPDFKILHITSKFMPDESDILKINLPQDVNNDNIDNKEPSEIKVAEQITSGESLTTSSSKEADNSSLLNSTNIENYVKVTDKRKAVDIEKVKETKSTDAQNPCETHLSKLCINQSIKESDREYQNHEDEYSYRNIEDTNIKLQDSEAQIRCSDILNLHELDDRSTEDENINTVKCNNNREILEPKLDEMSKNKDKSNKTSPSRANDINNSCNVSDKTVQISQSSCSQDTTISSTFTEDIKVETKKKVHKNRINENSRRKQKEIDKAEIEADTCRNLVMRVEQCFREWVTENTLCLLLGKADEKCQLVENLAQQDKYQLLCKKLNKLQMQDEREDRVDTEKNVLKPMPNLSEIQEEGKKLELKVRAFYEGQISYAIPVNNDEDSENNFDPILPLIDAYAPNALRRRIFLDKLNKILPELLRALTVNVNTYSASQYIYDNDKYSLIKLLTNTFKLTAANIVFKTAEWTLVGLIIIKMLSLIDTQLHSLLASKQVSMYMSMILTTYKLDSSYLDRLIMEVMSNADI